MSSKIVKPQVAPAEFGAGKNDLKSQVQGSGVHTQTKGAYSKVGEEQRLVQTGIQAATEGAVRGIGWVKEYQETKFTEETLKKYADNINDYLPDPEEARLKSEIVAQTGAEHQAWKTFGAVNSDGESISGEESAQTVNVAQVNTKAALDTLRKANIQGRIDTDTFLARAAEITRKAIARHPTLASEIIGDANRMYEIAGVKSHMSGLQQAQKSAAAVEQKETASLMTTWKESGYLVFPRLKNGEMDKEYMKNVLYSEQLDKKPMADLIAQSESRQKMTKIERQSQVDDWNKVQPDGQTKLSRMTFGKVNEVIQTFWKVIAEAEDSSKPKLYQMLDEQVRNIKEENERFIAGYRSFPSIDKHVTVFNSHLDVAVKEMKAIGNREDQLKLAENWKKFLEMDSYRKVVGEWGMSPLEQDMLSKSFTMSGGFLSMITKGEGSKENMMANTFLKYMGSVMLKMNARIAGDDKSSLSQGPSVLHNLYASDPENKDFIKLNSRGMEVSLDKILELPSKGEQFEETENLLKVYADPIKQEMLRKLDPVAINKLDRATRGYLGFIDNRLNKEMENIIKNGTDLKVSYSNGQLSFTSTTNPQIADHMSRRFSTRFGNAIKVLKATAPSEKLNTFEDFILGMMPNIVKNTGRAETLPEAQPKSDLSPSVQTSDKPFVSNSKVRENPRFMSEKEFQKSKLDAQKEFGQGEPDPAVKKKDTSEDVIVEEVTDEVAEEIKNHPWYEAFKKEEGYYPDLNTNQYRYQAAWEDGIRPEIGKDGKYHWGSKLIDGSDTKVNGHKTAYKNEISEEYGEQMVEYLDKEGITNREEAMKLIEIIKTTPSIHVKNNTKNLGYGVRHDPTQGWKGKGYAAGKHTVTMEDGEEVQITEYTVGVTIDGKIVDVPSVNSYTTEEDMKAIKESVRTGKPLPQEIEDKAQRHALDRIEAKKSIYLEEGEEQVPFAIDRFGGAKDLSGEVDALKAANKPAAVISPEDEKIRTRGNVFKNPEQEILSKEITGESLWGESLKRGKDIVGKAEKVAEYLLPSMNSLPIASPNNPNGMDKKENRFSFDTVESPELNELVERHFTRENKEGKGLNIKGSEKHTRNNWEIPKKILADLANKIAWTESRNRQSIRNPKEGSTATGFYQFIVGTQAQRDAKETTPVQTAINRVKSKLNNPPAWLDKLYVDGKVGELTRDQQTLLLLGDLLEKKGGDELWKIMLDPKSQDGTGEKYRKAQYDMYIKLHHTDKKGVPIAAKANAQKNILYVNKYYH